MVYFFSFAFSEMPQSAVTKAACISIPVLESACGAGNPKCKLLRRFVFRYQGRSACRRSVALLLISSTLTEKSKGGVLKLEHSSSLVLFLYTFIFTLLHFLFCTNTHMQT